MVPLQSKCDAHNRQRQSKTIWGVYGSCNEYFFHSSVCNRKSVDRLCLVESDLEDSDSPFEMTEETAGGLESGKESEFDRLLENESDISR